MPPRKSKEADTSDSSTPLRRSTRARKPVATVDFEPEPEVVLPKKRRNKRSSTSKINYEEEDNSNDINKKVERKDVEFDPDEDSNESVEKPKTPVRGARGRAKKEKEVVVHKDTPVPSRRGRPKRKAEEPEVKKETKKAKVVEDKGDKDEHEEEDQEAEDESEEDKKPEAPKAVKIPAAISEEPMETDEDKPEEEAKKEVELKKEEKKESPKEVKKKEEKELPKEASKKEDEVVVEEKTKEKEKEKEEPKKEEKKEDPKPEAPAEPAKEAEKKPAPVAEATASETDAEVDKSKENGVEKKLSRPIPPPCGYVKNSKVAQEGDGSFVSMVAKENKEEVVDLLNKLNAKFVCVQKCTGESVRQAAEQCGYNVYSSANSSLAMLCKMEDVERKIDVEYIRFTDLVKKELEHVTGEADKEKVAAYLNQHCNDKDEAQISSFSLKGKQVVVVNLCLESTNPSVCALEVGCLMRRVDDKNAIVLASHMPPIVLNTPAYELLRDGYFGNDAIENLQKLKDIKSEEDEDNKALVDFLWRSYQHSKPDMKSCYVTVMESESVVTSTGRGCLWHNQKGVLVTGVLNDASMVKADLIIN